MLQEQLEYHQHEHQSEVEGLKVAIEAKEAQVAQIMEQYQDQMVEVETLRGELSQLQESYDNERERYSKVHVRMQIKEKIQHDLGGLTETVVRYLGGGAHRDSGTLPGRGGRGSLRQWYITWGRGSLRQW